MRAAALRTSSADRRSSATPPLSVLCAPARAVFTTTGRPSSDAAATAVLRRRGVPLGDDRNAVALEQLVGSIGVEPARPLTARCSVRRAAVDVQLGRRAGGPPQPLRALSSEAERSGRGLRVFEAATARSVCAHHHRQQRLGRGLGDPLQDCDDGPRILDDRRHEQRDHRIDIRIRQHDRQGVLIRRGVRGAEQVDRVRKAGLARGLLGRARRVFRRSIVEATIQLLRRRLRRESPDRRRW